MKQKLGSRAMALLLAVVLSFTLIVPETFATEIDDDDDYTIEIIDEPADNADDEDEIIQSDFFTVDTETGEVEDIDTDTALEIIEENDAQPINESDDLVDIEDYDSTGDGWWDRYLEDRYGSDDCMADYWNYIQKDAEYGYDTDSVSKSTSPLISTYDVQYPTSATLSYSSSSIAYGGEGWSSYHFKINGNEGYCVDPAYPAPSRGTYAVTTDLTLGVSTHTQAQANEVVKIFYYSYGAPGFSKSLWPSTDCYGSTISNDQLYVASHLLLADVFSYNANHALERCNSTYRNWCLDNVIGHFTSSGDWDTSTNYTQTSRWKILAEQPDPSDNNFKVYMINYGNTNSTQILLGYVYTATGHLDLLKTSGNTTITVDNPCYSLADAVYGVYADSALTNQVETLKTDANGNSNTVTLDEGTYYVKELTPSKGYKLDTTTYTAVVTAGNTTTIQSVETPGADPIFLTVTKEAENAPRNGGPSLAGAQFEILYFNDYYYSTSSIPVKSYNADGTANYYYTNRWTIETKWDSDNDEYNAMLDKDYLVDSLSDDLYIVGDIAVIPYGSILIREVKAPDGYENIGSWTDSGKVLSGDEILLQYTAEVGEHDINLSFTRSDLINIYGGVAVPKIDADRDYAVPQGDATLADAEYTVYYNNSYDIVLDGKTYKKDDVAAKITTDEDGHASTGAYDLLYGSYYVLETKASNGYLLNTSFRFDFDITQNGVIVNADGTVTGPEYPQRGGIGIYKYDVETYTMTDEPQGDADLANAQFTIRNVSAESVVVKGGLKGEGWETYEKGEDVMTISTERYETDDGAFYYAHTAERALPYGTYEIRETASPEGYLLGTKE